MRKTIIFCAIAALFGLVAAAQASNDDAEQAMRKGGQMTYADTDDRGETAAHKMRERAEHGVRDRDHDAYEHNKEALKHEYRKRNDRD
jgi:hypothetical protein